MNCEECHIFLEECACCCGREGIDGLCACGGPICEECTEFHTFDVDVLAAAAYSSEAGFTHPVALKIGQAHEVTLTRRPAHPGPVHPVASRSTSIPRR